MNLCEVQALCQPAPSRDWGESCGAGSAGKHLPGSAAIDENITTGCEVTETFCEKDQPLGGELQVDQEAIIEDEDRRQSRLGEQRRVVVAE